MLVSRLLATTRYLNPIPLCGFAEVIIWGADHYCQRLPVGRIFSHLWKGVCASRKGQDGVAWHNTRRNHLTEKPVALMVWCIDQLKSPPDTTVLDPYMGSGTTGVAAIQRDRKFIGVEIERRWFDIACRRIEEAQRQGRLPLDAA